MGVWKIEKQQIFEKCVELAKTTSSNNEGGPFGAAIVDKEGNIVTVASNHVLVLNDPTAHAEIQAIRQACDKLKTHDLTGYTLHATGYPCPMCMSAIIWANIKEVYYACPVEDAEEIGFRDDLIYDFINSGCKNKEIMDLKWAGSSERLICKSMYIDYENEKKEIY